MGGPQIRVLGPVNCTGADGATISLAPRKIELLAVLAASANEVVDRDELAASVWGEVNPATRNRLKTQLAQLRESLAGIATIDFRGAGYRLSVGADRLDATSFVRRCREASDEPAERAAQLLGALELWRTPVPFVGVDNALVQQCAWTLGRQREQAVIAAATAIMAAPGDAARLAPAALGYLRELFDTDHCRGDAAVRLAGVLHVAGRSAQAMTVLGDHRRALAGRGLLPAADVVALEREVLAVGSERAIAGRIDPTADGPVVVRQALLDALDRAMTEGGAVLVGESGSGKSTLLASFVEWQRQRGRVVVTVAAAEQPSVAMEPIVDLLSGLREHDPTRFGAHLERGQRAAAARLIAGDSGVALGRSDLIAELVDLTASVIVDRDLLVAVDDAQWLDRNSQEVIEGVIVAGCRIVLCARPRARATLGPPWDRLAVVEVRPFHAGEVAEFVRQRSSRPIDPAVADVDRLLRRTGGSPLLLRLLVDEPGDGDDERVVPATVQYAVAQRTRALSRRSLAVLQRAAVGGTEFAMEALKRLAPDAEGELADAIDEGLVRLDPDTGRGQFAHGLVAEALVSTIPEGLRISWHDEWCDALHDAGATALARLEHAVAAASLDPRRAVRVVLEASRELGATTDWEGAERLARRGLGIARDRGLVGETVAVELLAQAGVMARHAMRPGFDGDLLAAADAAARGGDGELLATAVTELCRHGLTTHAGSVDARVLPLLETALASDLPVGVRAELCAAAAGFFSVSALWPRGRVLFHEALAWTDDADDVPRVARILYGAHSGLGHPDDLALRAIAAERLLAIDEPEPQGEGQILALHVALVRADRPGVDRALAAISALEPHVREPIEKAGLHAALATGATLDDRLEEAEALAAAVVERFGRFYPPSWQFATRLALGLPILDAQGRLGEVWPLIDALRGEDAEVALWHALVAWIGSAIDERSTARTAVDWLVERQLPLCEDFTYTAQLAGLARAALALERADLAALVDRRLAPYSGQLTWNGLSTHGPIDAARALCHLVRGDTALAAHYVRSARATAHRFRAEHLLWPELGSVELQLGEQ